MKKYLVWIISLLTLHFLFSIGYGQFPEIGEKYYSQGINKWWIQKLSQFTGIFPFSLFEILVYVAIFFIIGGIIWFIIQCRKKSSRKYFILHIVAAASSIMVTVYFVFSTFWGLNYKRISLFEKHNWSLKKHSVEELVELYEYLLDEANEIRKQLPSGNDGQLQLLSDWQGIFDRAYLGYEKMALLFPEIVGDYGKPKPLMISPLMNYTGITGIYSPFTGEANVNISMAPLTLPVTTLHEMAHQRGYTGENECNFLGYIAAISHPDPDFQYSGYMLAIIYVSNAIYKEDYQLLWKCNKQMSEQVKKDLEDYNTFWDRYEGKVEEIATQVNNTYLKTQGIEAGVKSYGEMIDLLLAYYGMNDQLNSGSDS